MTERESRRSARGKAEASRADVADSVSRPELRELIERLPLWRRPGYLLRRLHQIHNAIFLEQCGAFDITPVQYGLLTTLSLHPDADQNTLAQELGIDRTNVADVLARLARRKLVRRHRGVQDRRTVLARLTPEGERLTLAMHRPMSRAQRVLLDPLPPEERDAFIVTMLRLVDANNHYGAALGPDAGDRDGETDT